MGALLKAKGEKLSLWAFESLLINIKLGRESCLNSDRLREALWEWNI
jgi:hypothetical protein